MAHNDVPNDEEDMQEDSSDDNNKITKNNKNTKGLVLCRGKWCDLHQQSLRAGVNYTHYCNTLWTGVGKSTTSTPNTEWTRWTSPLDSHSFSRIIPSLFSRGFLSGVIRVLTSPGVLSLSFALVPSFNRTGCSYVSSFYYWVSIIIIVPWNMFPFSAYYGPTSSRGEGRSSSRW